MSEFESPTARAAGLENPATLDAMVLDPESGRVLVVMFETRPWTLGDLQLFQLQEKLNAYASFVLDGEMAESCPEAAGRGVAIQLRTVHEPSDAALLLLDQVRTQLAFQEVQLEVIRIDEQLTASEACACGKNQCSD